MVNAKDYISKKEKGLAEIVEAGGGYAIAIKKYSVEDGSQIEPEIQALSLTEVDKQIADKQKEIDDLNELKTDANNLIK